MKSELQTQEFILYEIALSIGNSLDLQVNLKQALTTMLRKLDGVGIAIYASKTKEVIHAIPKRRFIEKYQHCFFAAEQQDSPESLLVTYQQIEGDSCYLFRLPETGYLLLVRKKPLTDTISKMLKQICIKLDNSIQACNANAEIKEKEKVLQQTLIKLKAAKDAKERFLANMSHEIRTPLNGIIGFMNELSETQLDAQQQSYLDIISDSSETLLGVINDILDFSKIESGLLEIEKRAFNLNETLSPATKILKSKANEKNLSLELELEATRNISVLSDSLRLKQVLMNLISNAIKFTQQGHVRVQTQLLESDLGSVRIRFSVEDTGIGIEPKRQVSIFNPFIQADYSTSRKYGGTGLGLAISRQIVELLGGELHLESEIGKGSCFYFDLEMQTSDIQSASKSKPEVGNSKLDYSGKKVLAVEDNPVNQLLIKALLAKLEVPFDLAENGLEAVNAYQAKHYDLILMDINMPVMSGLEALEKITELQSQGGYEVPVVALTANALQGDHKNYIDKGMKFCLTKPVKVNELTAILNQYLA